jgi:hypothetical protein
MAFVPHAVTMFGCGNNFRPVGKRERKKYDKHDLWDTEGLIPLIARRT